MQKNTAIGNMSEWLLTILKLIECLQNGGILLEKEEMDVRNLILALLHLFYGVLYNTH